MKQCRLIVLGLVLITTGVWFSHHSHPVPEAEPTNAVSHFGLASCAPAGAGESKVSRAAGGSFASEELPQASLSSELWDLADAIRRGPSAVEVSPLRDGLPLTQ